MVFLLLINFFTRSKKASSSELAAVVVDGGIGSGSAGTNVGETGATSVCGCAFTGGC